MILATTEIKAEKKTAMFSASRISELLAGGEGKTRNKYILDLAMQEIGIENDFDTKEMRHGIINQINSFEQIIKPKYKLKKIFKNIKI